jgi:hypothetical protein
VRVYITRRDANVVAAQYEINLGTANYQVTDREYHDEAWRCAVADGVVVQNERDLYWFKLEPTKTRV